MDPYSNPVTAPVTDVIADVPVDVAPDADGGGWSRVWVVLLIILKFGIPVIAAGLGIYLLYRYFTKGKRNGQTQVAKVDNIAATLKAMTPEERQAYMDAVLGK